MQNPREVSLSQNTDAKKWDLKVMSLIYTYFYVKVLVRPNMQTLSIYIPDTRDFISGAERK